MNKSLCALVHKPGSTREAFQRYYEDNHAPLAIGLFPFSGYVRNHLIDPGAFGWDTISEFWSGDIAEAASLMDGPIGETMRADEAKFMDRSRIAPGGAEELVLSTGAHADGDGRRTCLLLHDTTGSEQFRHAATQWASALAEEHAGVSIDFVTSWQQPSFPAAAVIWLPGWDTKIDIPPQLVITVLKARMVETPAAKLLSRRDT